MIQTKLNHLVQHLKLGDSVRTVCPFCDGGSTNENSFVAKVTEAGVLYNCFRASCKRSGIIANISTPFSRGDGSPVRDKKYREFTGLLIPLPESIYQERFMGYQISIRTCRREGIRYAPEIRRIYFPLYDYMGYQIGENLRGVHSVQKPKVLVNKHLDVPLLHFPLCTNPFTDTVTLVEDQTSAICVGQEETCCSMNGTHLPQESLLQLISLKYEKVKIMLDGDKAGYEASVELEKKLRPFFEVEVVYLPLGLDPKDLYKRG